MQQGGTVMKRCVIFLLGLVFGGVTQGIWPVQASTSLSSTTVELAESLHFQTPAGDDVVVGPGDYQVEAAEAWLKLLPMDEGPASAILLEATAGEHEEPVTKPTVRLQQEPDNRDMTHVVLLHPDGSGLEAIGTHSGLRPRGMNLSLLKKAAGSQRIAVRPDVVLPGPVQGKLSPADPTPPPACGPTHTIIPESIISSDSKFKWDSHPHAAVFQNRLHVVANVTCKDEFGFDFCGASLPSHFIFDGDRWRKNNREFREGALRVPEGSSVALAADRFGLVAVWKDEEKQLWYSRYYDQWAPKQKIPGQYSKSTPALAAQGGKIHLLHQGKTSDDLWHSTFSSPPNQWTLNVKIGRQSSGSPGFARLREDSVHTVYRKAARYTGDPVTTTLRHTFLGRNGVDWLPPYDGPKEPKSQDAPVLTEAGDDPRVLGLMVHRGSTTKRLWSTLYGRNDPRKPTTFRWYDDQPLLGLTSDGPVALASYMGCIHMVHKDRNKLIHSTFSLKQAHPTVIR